VEILCKKRVLAARYEQQIRKQLVIACRSGRGTSKSGSKYKTEDRDYPRAVRKVINALHAISQRLLLLTFNF